MISSRGGGAEALVNSPFPCSAESALHPSRPFEAVDRCRWLVTVVAWWSAPAWSHAFGSLVVLVQLSVAERSARVARGGSARTSGWLRVRCGPLDKRQVDWPGLCVGGRSTRIEVEGASGPVGEWIPSRFDVERRRGRAAMAVRRRAATHTAGMEMVGF